MFIVVSLHNDESRERGMMILSGLVLLVFWGCLFRNRGLLRAGASQGREAD